MKLVLFQSFFVLFIFINLISKSLTKYLSNQQNRRQTKLENYDVAAETPECVLSGRRILEKKGTAADAAIAVLLCIGVTRPEAIGLGGGFLFLFYNRTSQKTTVVDAREVAPAAATEDMFENQPDLSKDGPKAIAVPGQVAGLVYVHKKFGRLPWKGLFRDAIDLAKNGFYVGKNLDKRLKSEKNIILKHKEMKNVFVNPKTNRIYKLGEKIKMKQLAKTLKCLAKAKDPGNYFYKKISVKIVKDINLQADDWNGTKPIITVEDFKNYRLNLNRKVVTSKLKRSNLQLYTCPLPGSGNILAFILKVMEKFDGYDKVGKSLEGTVDFWQRLVETFKFAYAKRMMLGDNAPGYDSVNDTVKELMSDEFVDFVISKIDMKKTHSPDYYNVSYYQPEDHGTSHISVLDKFGNAVAVTSTINNFFGSKVLSPSTGIILNDEMDDFSSPGVTNVWGVPATPYNHIQPGKRPLSGMVPSIFTDTNGDVKLIIGAAGGPVILTAVATVVIRHFWLGENIRMADRAPRLHHQLFPNVLYHDSDFDKEVIEQLKMKKHKTKVGERARVMGISSDGRRVQTNAD